MTDLHLMDRQNEGIWGIDPVRHGRVATTRIWIPDGHNMLNSSRLIQGRHS